MSSLTKDQVRELLNASLALQENPAEKTFWLEKLDSMTEDGLQKLAAILESEAAQKEKIAQEKAQKTVANNTEYMETLRKVKTVLIPQIQEHAERSQENPEDLLSQLKNA